MRPSLLAAPAARVEPPGGVGHIEGGFVQVLSGEVVVLATALTPSSPSSA